MSANRYDFMRESAVVDEKTGTYFPDPLTLDYGSFNMTQRPDRESLTDDKINYFWRTYMNEYGTRDYEDVVLTLNNTPHKNFLLEFDSIYYPDLSDIKKSFSKLGRN